MSSGESGVLRGSEPRVATSHYFPFFLAECQSVVCGTTWKTPLGAFERKVVRRRLSIYTIFDRVSFYGLNYRRSLSGLLDIRSFVTESAETANRKLPLMLA